MLGAGRFFSLNFVRDRFGERKSEQTKSAKWNMLFILPPHTDKTIPLQAWTGPEGFRRLRLPDFKTFGT